MKKVNTFWRAIVAAVLMAALIFSIQAKFYVGVVISFVVLIVWFFLCRTPYAKAEEKEESGKNKTA